MCNVCELKVLSGFQYFSDHPKLKVVNCIFFAFKIEERIGEKM